jgi:hypothetical protein
MTKGVKLRKESDGADYEKYNDGKPITITEWFQMTCAFDGSLLAKIPAVTPIDGVETVDVT